jgi:hypothetical protein
MVMINTYRFVYYNVYDDNMTTNIGGVTANLDPKGGGTINLGLVTANFCGRGIRCPLMCPLICSYIYNGFYAICASWGLGLGSPNPPPLPHLLPGLNPLVVTQGGLVGTN